VPENPEALVKELTEEFALIDDYLMPRVLSMAKFHVEAVNLLNSTCLQSAKSSEGTI
jgi:hypothetical protein